MSVDEKIARLIADIESTLSSVQDPVERAQAMTEALTAVGELNVRLRDLRRDTIVELNTEHGMGYKTIAAALGISEGRVAQIVKDWRTAPRPGKIEVDARVEASAFRTQGMSDEDLVFRMVPRILLQRGSQALTAKDIAAILDVKPSLVSPVLKQHKAR